MILFWLDVISFIKGDGVFDELNNKEIVKNIYD